MHMHACFQKDFIKAHVGTKSQQYAAGKLKQRKQMHANSFRNKGKEPTTLQTQVITQFCYVL